MGRFLVDKAFAIAKRRPSGIVLTSLWVRLIGSRLSLVDNAPTSVWDPFKIIQLKGPTFTYSYVADSAHYHLVLSLFKSKSVFAGIVSSVFCRLLHLHT